MRVFVAALVSFIALGNAAGAAQPPAPTPTAAGPPAAAKPVLCAICRDYPITVFAIGTFFQGNAGGSLFRRTAAGVGASLYVRDWLMLTSGVYGGRTWFDYDKDASATETKGMAMKKMPLSTSNVKFRLHTPADISVEVGMSARLPMPKRAPKWLEFWVYSGYESSLYRLDQLNVESAVFSTTGGLLGDQMLDVTSQAQTSATMYYSWHRVRVGLRTRFDFKWGGPYFDIGFERLDGAIDIVLKEDARKQISAFGYKPDDIAGHFSITYNALIIVPGLTIKWNRRVWSHVQGLAIPYSGNWYGGVQVIPFEWRF